MSDQRACFEVEAGRESKRSRRKGVLRAFSDADEMEDGGKCMRVRQASSRASILSGVASVSHFHRKMFEAL